MIIKGSLKVEGMKDKLNQWQSDDSVHPLTCGNNSKHNLLIPYIEEISNEEYEISLRCEDCDWIQDIPVFIGG